METGTVDLGGSDLRLYVQVAASVRRQIADGVLTAGSVVSSTAALAAEHFCSRPTCAKGLRVLAAEGLIVRVPGCCYFVASCGGAPDPEDAVTATAGGADAVQLRRMS